jgi:hypothetical protein
MSICNVFLENDQEIKIQTNKVENVAKALRSAVTSQFDNFGRTVYF